MSRTSVKVEGAVQVFPLQKENRTELEHRWCMAVVSSYIDAYG